MAKDFNGNLVGAAGKTKLIKVTNQNAEGTPAADEYFVLRADVQGMMTSPEITEKLRKKLGLAKDAPLKLPEDDELQFMFTENDLVEALARAINNPEDVPEVSWWTDLWE